MNLVALMPWWCGIALALVLYLLLHRAALQPLRAATLPSDVGAMVMQSLWRSLAMVGQYVLPILCLAGAALSAWKRQQRKSLVDDVVHSAAADSLDGMTWAEFEMLVGEGFRLQGYQVLETGGGGADGGVDLVLSRPGKNGSEKFLVQCKQWRAFKVGVDVVRELYGVMAARGAAGGFVVTSGRFTEAAVEFAAGRNVSLVDGVKLHALLRGARGVKQPPAAVIANQPIAKELAIPKCPMCSRAMIRRTAKRGPNAGREFFGCTGFPGCRGSIPA